MTSDYSEGFLTFPVACLPTVVSTSRVADGCAAVNEHLLRKKI